MENTGEKNKGEKRDRELAWESNSSSKKQKEDISKETKSSENIEEHGESEEEVSEKDSSGWSKRKSQESSTFDGWSSNTWSQYKSPITNSWKSQGQNSLAIQSPNPNRFPDQINSPTVNLNMLPPSEVDVMEYRINRLFGDDHETRDRFQKAEKKKMQQDYIRTKVAEESTNIVTKEQIKEREEDFKKAMWLSARPRDNKLLSITQVVDELAATIGVEELETIKMKDSIFHSTGLFLLAFSNGGERDLLAKAKETTSLVDLKEVNRMDFERILYTVISVERDVELDEIRKRCISVFKDVINVTTYIDNRRNKKNIEEGKDEYKTVKILTNSTDAYNRMLEKGTIKVNGKSYILRPPQNSINDYFTFYEIKDIPTSYGEEEIVKAFENKFKVKPISANRLITPMGLKLKIVIVIIESFNVDKIHSNTLAIGMTEFSIYIKEKFIPTK